MSLQLYEINIANTLAQVPQFIVIVLGHHAAAI
jgi:hypothetical protein